jgi:hypothetical protein
MLVGTGGADLLGAMHALDAQLTHQTHNLVPKTEVLAGTLGGLPQLAGAVHPVVRDPQAQQQRQQHRVTHRTCRGHPRLRRVVGRVRELQGGADRLDAELVLVLLDVVHHQRCGRSSSAAKKTAEDFKIAFARLTSRSSCSSYRILACSAEVVPGVSPLSTSACLTHPLGRRGVAVGPLGVRARELVSSPSRTRSPAPIATGRGVRSPRPAQRFGPSHGGGRVR